MPFRLHFERPLLCVHLFFSRPNYFWSPSSLLNYCDNSRVIVTTAGSYSLRNLLHSALNWPDLEGHTYSRYLLGNVSVVKFERHRSILLSGYEHGPLETVAEPIGSSVPVWAHYFLLALPLSPLQPNQV